MSSFIDKRVQTVHDLPEDEKPRERLRRFGAESLSDAELIAIVLRSGIPGHNALDISRNLIKDYGSIHSLSRLKWSDLHKRRGLGIVKALTLESVFELSRRLATAPLGERIILRSPEDVYAHFGSRLRDERIEVFIVAFLNAAKSLTGSRVISRGGQTATIAEPSEIYRHALNNGAHSIIVLHNHPSGNLNPSEADIQLTKRLISSGKILGIPLEDHLIVAGHHYLSFRANDLVTFNT